MFDDTVTGEPLVRILAEESTAEARCEAACLLIAEEPDTLDEVLACDALGDVDDTDPWNPANTEVTVVCSTQHSGPGFCTGRRPQGHHESEVAIDGAGAWFAVHAHLERASVTAFEELATWLDRYGAPSEFAARSRAAAHDEVCHAQLMQTQARRLGVEAPSPTADAPAQDLLAIALHNAVEGCVHEAFAAIVAAHQARVATDPELREVFTSIAADELRHGQLAWDLHAWLCDQLSPAERARVEAAQARALEALPRVIASNAESTPAGLGWPTPQVAVQMARAFASELQAAV
jgi:hypothetical protein